MKTYMRYMAVLFSTTVGAVSALAVIVGLLVGDLSEPNVIIKWSEIIVCSVGIIGLTKIAYDAYQVLKENRK